MLEQEFLAVGSPDEARKAVRLNVYYGADFIKVVADPDGRFITVDEMKAIVEEAHRSKLKVAVHATTLTGIQTAVARPLTPGTCPFVPCTFLLTPAAAYGSLLALSQVSPARGGGQATRSEPKWERSVETEKRCFLTKRTQTSVANK
jgi:hypothetical protein